ncbi:MAG: energy transducer TonB [Ferruginibacter sp.]
MKSKGKLFTMVFMMISLLSVSQTVVHPTENPTDDLNKIYVRVDEEAQFPGGVLSWQKFLEKNLNMALLKPYGAPDGTYQITVRFIVSYSGIITDVTSLTKFGYGMENEAMRIIKAGPKWTPAINNGRRVNSFKTQQVTFIINNK